MKKQVWKCNLPKMGLAQSHANSNKPHSCSESVVAHAAVIPQSPGFVTSENQIIRWVFKYIPGPSKTTWEVCVSQNENCPDANIFPPYKLSGLWHMPQADDQDCLDCTRTWKPTNMYYPQSREIFEFWSLCMCRIRINFGDPGIRCMCKIQVSSLVGLRYMSKSRGFLAGWLIVMTKN